MTTKQHRRDLKVKLIKAGMTMKALSERAGIPYYRLAKAMNGYQYLNSTEEITIHKVLQEEIHKNK